MSMTDKIVANVMNPFPILQQPSSMITTNPFIPNKQKEMELEVIQQEANNIISQQYSEHITSSIKNLKLNQILDNISSSCIGLMDDLFAKPDEVEWRYYIIEITSRDQRYAYIGILFVFMALIIAVLRSN